jgi:hypothetical protein
LRFRLWRNCDYLKSRKKNISGIKETYPAGHEDGRSVKGIKNARIWNKNVPMTLFLVMIYDPKIPMG